MRGGINPSNYWLLFIIFVRSRVVAIVDAWMDSDPGVCVPIVPG